MDHFDKRDPMVQTGDEAAEERVTGARFVGDGDVGDDADAESLLSANAKSGAGDAFRDGNELRFGTAIDDALRCDRWRLL